MAYRPQRRTGVQFLGDRETNGDDSSDSEPCCFQREGSSLSDGHLVALEWDVGKEKSTICGTNPRSLANSRAKRVMKA